MTAATDDSYHHHSLTSADTKDNLYAHGTHTTTHSQESEAGDFNHPPDEL